MDGVKNVVGSIGEEVNDIFKEAQSIHRLRKQNESANLGYRRELQMALAAESGSQKP
jgi:hypothetical protein